MFGNGDTTGYGYHGDFINGWNTTVLQEAINLCANTADGLIGDCPPIAASDDPFFNINCPEQPPIFNESVHGLLKALPGCNPPTGGLAIIPGSNPPTGSSTTAPQNICPIQPAVNFVNNSAANVRYDLVAGQQVGVWTYLGCAYDQDSTRNLGGPYFSSTSMTIEICTDYCESQNYLLAGIEYSTQCKSRLAY